MNGPRSTFKRKGYLLTAFAAAVLLAASPGTAWAQVNNNNAGTIKIDSVTLSPAAVAEGDTATATVKFTVENTSTHAEATTIAADEVRVGFAFVGASSSNSARYTNATAADFTGLTDNPAENMEFVDVLATRLDASRQYTKTHSFRVNHDLDAETDRFKVVAFVDGWNVTNDPAAAAAAGQNSDLDGSGTDPVESADNFTIRDDETQTYALSIPQGSKGAIEEGGTDAPKVTLTADPKRTSPNTVPLFTLVVEPSRGFDFDMFDFTDMVTTEQDTWRDAIRRALSGAAAGDDLDIMGAGSEGSRVTKDIGTIATAGVDKNRVDDTLTLKLYIGGVGTEDLVTELAITAEDIHKLAAPDHITAVAKDAALSGETVTQVVEGGDPVYLTITVDRGSAGTKDLTTGEALTVDLRASAGQVGDIVVEPSRINLPEGSGKSVSDVEIMLTARPDEDVGDEVLMLELVVTGTDSELGSGNSIGVFPITIVDATTKKVTPKTTEADYQKIKDAMAAAAGDYGLNPDESFMVMTSDLFDVMDGYDASYTASVVGEGVAVGISAAGDTVTVDAKSATSGEGAKVTITAKVDPVGSSLIANQTVSDVASVTFPVMVVDTPLMVEVTAEPMEIEEGGTSMITATASRAIEAGDGAVTIDLVVVGEATLDADSITIAAGATSGSVMLTSTADDDMTDETVVVVASGSGITGSTQIEIAVTEPTPEPVPALPLLGQLLLGLGLLGGGARHLYRRRQG